MYWHCVRKARLLASLLIKSFVVTVLGVASAPAEMNSDFERYSVNPHAPLAWQHTAEIDQYHWVLVGGFFNETVRKEYFSENAKVLSEIGATKVSRIFPSSFHSASFNAKRLNNQLMELYHQGGRRPIVLIGHSKGGLESMACVLEFPELISKNIVAEVVLIQAPLGGNKLTDSQGILRRLLIRTVLSPTAYSSLQTDDIQKIVTDKVNKLASTLRQRLSQHIHYVLSSKPANQMGRALKAAARLSTTMTVPYDGLVTRQDMWLSGFGEILGDMKNVDHLEFVLAPGSLVADNSSRNNVRGFTKSLVANLFKSKRPGNTEFKTLTQKIETTAVSAAVCRAVL